MKDIFAVLAFVILLAVSLLTFFNRGSEKILGTVLASAITSISAVLVVLIFGVQKNETNTFPVRVYYSKSTLQLSLPQEGWRIFPAISVLDSASKEHPEIFQDKSGLAAEKLYHHLLQKSLIDWIAMHYRGHWQSSWYRFKLPSETSEVGDPLQAPDLPSETLSQLQLVEKLQGNIFAADKNFIESGMGIPPGTNLIVKPPTVGLPSTGEIKFANRLFTITITTKSGGGSGTGAPLELRHVIGFQPAQSADFAYVGYLVTTKVEYTKWFQGDPKMERYKLWALQLTSEIQKDFDEQILWERTKETYRLVNDIKKETKEPKTP